MTPHVDPETLDQASGPARARMIEHVAACPACRGALAESDPSRLFALLSLSPVPAEVLEQVSRRVAVEIGRDASPGAAPWAVPGGAKRLAAAAVAAMALLTGAATWLARPERPAPLAAARADVDVLPATGVSQVVDLTVGDLQVVMVYNGDLRL